MYSFFVFSIILEPRVSFICGLFYVKAVARICPLLCECWWEPFWRWKSWKILNCVLSGYYAQDYSMFCAQISDLKHLLHMLVVVTNWNDSPFLHRVLTLYVCTFLQHHHIRMDIDKSNTYLGIMLSHQVLFLYYRKRKMVFLAWSAKYLIFPIIYLYRRKVLGRFSATSQLQD